MGPYVSALHYLTESYTLIFEEHKQEKKEKAEKDDDAQARDFSQALMSVAQAPQEGDVKLQGVEDWTPGPLHSYEDLLARLYKIIEEHNPTVGAKPSSFSGCWCRGNKERYVLKPPQVVRVGSKKVRRWLFLMSRARSLG